MCDVWACTRGITRHSVQHKRGGKQRAPGAVGDKAGYDFKDTTTGNTGWQQKEHSLTLTPRERKMYHVEEKVIVVVIA